MPAESLYDTATARIRPSQPAEDGEGAALNVPTTLLPHQRVRTVGLSSSHDVLLEHFEQHLAALDPDGRLVDRIEDLTGAARLAAMHALASAHWTEQLGPFFSSDAVRELLGRGGAPVSRQAVSKRRDVLTLRTGSGRVVYPAFQFDGRTPVRGMRAVLELFDGVPVSRWTLASWLSSPAPELAGRAPIDALRAGEADAVLKSAARWAAALRA